MSETNTYQIGQTVYMEGHELVVTATRLDRGAGGATAMIWLSDPILHEKEKMDRDDKERLVTTQRVALETVTKVMNDE